LLFYLLYGRYDENKNKRIEARGKVESAGLG
jgi:hypothetical protein